MATFGQYVTAEQGSRAEGEENILSMLENVTQKLQEEMKKERSARQYSEESFFKLPGLMPQGCPWGAIGPPVECRSTRPPCIDTMMPIRKHVYRVARAG